LRSLCICAQHMRVMDVCVMYICVCGCVCVCVGILYPPGSSPDLPWPLEWVPSPDDNPFQAFSPVASAGQHRPAVAVAAAASAAVRNRSLSSSSPSLFPCVCSHHAVQPQPNHHHIRPDRGASHHVGPSLLGPEQRALRAYSAPPPLQPDPSVPAHTSTGDDMKEGDAV